MSRYDSADSFAASFLARPVTHPLSQTFAPPACASTPTGLRLDHVIRPASFSTVEFDFRVPPLLSPGSIPPAPSFYPPRPLPSHPGRPCGGISPSALTDFAAAPDFFTTSVLPARGLVCLSLSLSPSSSFPPSTGGRLSLSRGRRLCRGSEETTLPYSAIFGSWSRWRTTYIKAFPMWKHKPAPSRLRVILISFRYRSPQMR